MSRECPFDVRVEKTFIEAIMNSMPFKIKFEMIGRVSKFLNDFKGIMLFLFPFLGWSI